MISSSSLPQLHSKFPKMAVLSIANLFSFFTPSKPPQPAKTPLTLQSSISVSNNDDHRHPLQLSSSNSDVTSIICPSLAYSNTLYFRSGYNVQVLVDDNEHEEKLIGRFRREVMRAGVIQECKRRRYFENSQDEKKRKSREAARRNRRRRGPFSKNFSQDNQEASKSKRDDEEEDNWELPDGGIPF